MSDDMPEIDLGDLVPTAAPIIRRNTDTNQLAIEWGPDGKPGDLIINADLLEGFVTERNAMVAANRAMHAVLTKARLGQSINKDDWATVGLVKSPVVIDLKARRSQSNDTACACGASGIPLQHDTSDPACLRHDIQPS